jgi:hypothetical protein
MQRQFDEHLISGSQFFQDSELLNSFFVGINASAEILESGTDKSSYRYTVNIMRNRRINCGE